MERLFPKEHQGTLRNPKEPWGTSRNNYNTQSWVKERNDRQKKVSPKPTTRYAVGFAQHIKIICQEGLCPKER